MAQCNKKMCKPVNLEQSDRCLYPEPSPYKSSPPFQQPGKTCQQTDAPVYNQPACPVESRMPDNVQEGMTTQMPDVSRLKKKKSIPFWSQDPNVLLNQKYVTEFFPVDNMSFNQKLNAITRLVIIMTLLAFLYTKSPRLLAIGSLSILAIFLLYFAYRKTGDKEGLGSYMAQAGLMTRDPSLPPLGPMKPQLPVVKLSGEVEDDISPETLNLSFDKPTPDNPMSNVLVPDYRYDVNKKPAPPSYTQRGNETILANAKRMVVEQNPGQPDIADKLFGDLGDEMVFEQSMQPFYSNANTTIPNDQGAFAQFCYGDMISAKEGNMMALGRNNQRWIDGYN
jgi:hypothetical protein